MRIGRLVRAGADAVRDRVRRLAGVTGLREPVADEDVELGEARAGLHVVDGGPVDREQLLEELVVLGRQIAGADVLRVVAPVAVHADPDLEQCRLALLHGPVAGRGEGADARARPDERKPARQLDQPPVAGALPVHEALPERPGLALLHPRSQLAPDVLHRLGRELVREAHALDLLLGLDRSRLDEEGRRILGRTKRLEEGLRVGRRLAHHAVGSLGAQRELEPDASVAAGAHDLLRQLDGPCGRRPRIGLVVALEQTDVRRPGRPLGVGLLGLEGDERHLPFPREHDRVIALHGPVVREIEDVVGRADDERVQIPVGHQAADAVELGAVRRPAHRHPPGR